MPHHKSTVKRLRQNVKQRAYNKALRTRVRNVIKDARDAEKGDVQAKVVSAHAHLDRAVKQGIVKRATADRLKSRLAKHANRVVAA